MQAVYARVKCQENVLKEYKKHAENGTFPKRMKSMKSYPKMQCPEAQKHVHEAYHQVECTVLDEAIQEIEKNLAARKEHYQSLLQQRKSKRQVLEGMQEKTPKISHHTRVKTELIELQKKYDQLCAKLDTLSKSHKNKDILHTGEEGDRIRKV
ncbi:hypothetical protein AWC38_SpisGene25342, partial [Stylophora pistillata]